MSSSQLNRQHISDMMALSSPLQNLSAVISATANATTTAARPPRGRHWEVHSAASNTSAAAPVQFGGYEEGKLERPKWAGETPLSRLVQALISFKPLYSVLKLGARRVFIRFFIVPSSLSFNFKFCIIALVTFLNSKRVYCEG